MTPEEKKSWAEDLLRCKCLISAVDLDEYGLDNMWFEGAQNPDGTYKPTALQLLIYAHEELYGGDWSQVTFDALPGSSYFRGGIFGFTENLVYTKYSCAFFPPRENLRLFEVRCSFEGETFSQDKQQNSRNADAFREFFVRYWGKGTLQNRFITMARCP